MKQLLLKLWLTLFFCMCFLLTCRQIRFYLMSWPCSASKVTILPPELSLCGCIFIYMTAICAFACRCTAWSWYVYIYKYVCVCVSTGCSEEAGSRVSRQHWGSRPPAADQTAASRLFPAVLQHGGELCVIACSLNSVRTELDSWTRCAVSSQRWN